MLPSVIIFIVGTTCLLILKPVGASSLTATQKGTSIGSLAKELALLGVYGSQRAVIIRNKASDWLRLWCASADDNLGEQHLSPGESFSFSFKPKVIGGHTVFWCTTDIWGFWARWDVFGGEKNYSDKDKYAKAYEYEIRNDGVYYKGGKIRGLNSGRYKYVLWEHYDGNKNPFGTSLTGFVDGGMCNNIPGFMERKTSDVTLCDHSCVILYSQLHCRGETSRLHAQNGCTNFFLTHFNDKARSVKGC